MRRLGIILLSLGGCVQTSEVVTRIDAYYPLDSLITSQVTLLVENDRSVRKSVWLDGLEEDTVLTFAEASWRDELKLFSESDLNIPSYVGIYEREVGLEDSSSNLLFDRFSPREGHHPTIKRFEIYYYQTIDQVKRIYIEASEENELYFSNKTLTMGFGTMNGEPILSTYAIMGNQKLISRDSVKYRISGQLIAD